MYDDELPYQQRQLKEYMRENGLTAGVGQQYTGIFLEVNGRIRGLLTWLPKFYSDFDWNRFDVNDSSFHYHILPALYYKDEEAIYYRQLVSQTQKSTTDESLSSPSKQQGDCKFPHFNAAFKDFEIPVSPLRPLFSYIHPVIQGYGFMIGMAAEKRQMPTIIGERIYDHILADIECIRLTAPVAVSSFQRLCKFFLRAKGMGVGNTLKNRSGDLRKLLGDRANKLDNVILSVSLAREMDGQTNACTIELLRKKLAGLDPIIRTQKQEVWLQSLDEAAREYLIALAHYWVQPAQTVQHFTQLHEENNQSTSHIYGDVYKQDVKKAISDVAQQAHMEYAKLVYGIGDVTAKDVHDEVSTILKAVHGENGNARNTGTQQRTEVFADVR